MPRDYKHSGRKSSKKGKQGLPGWAWFVAGVATSATVFALHSAGVVSPSRVSDLVSEAASKVPLP